MLGGSTSTNLSRGRLLGYGLYLTNRRIIGVKRNGIGLIILIAGVGSLATFQIIAFLYLHDPLIGFASLLLTGAADPGSRYLTQKFGERFLSRGDRNISGQLKRRREFEVRREEISALYLSKATKKTWKLDIVFKDQEKKEIRINISGGKHYHILRDLVEAFSRIQPTIYFHEF